MKVLQLTAHFRPNIGGVETHLDDLVKALIKRGWVVSILTYQPLTTKASWKVYETEKNLTILRIPWMSGFFYKFVSHPLAEFLYLVAGLFLILPYFLLWKKPDVIHAHGLVAGFVGVFWGKVFRKRVVISTHSIYSFPQKGLYRNFASWIFKSADYCLGLSKKACDEILSLEISKLKVNNFTYWIDLERFQRVDNAKFNLNWKDKFIVLFVGRLIVEKGLEELLESAKNWNQNIKLVIIGSGPLEENIKYQIKGYYRRTKIKNIKYLGKIDNEKLPVYYSAADVLIVPSVSEEGFGRVILESLACGTPVIGARSGAITEAMDKTVGEIVDISSDNIRQTVEYFYTHRDELKKLSGNCRKFAERRYSEKNVDKIIASYTS